MSNGHSHRPTLKQSNKGFKSKHSSKGSLKAAAKGKVGSPSGQNSHKNVTVSSKKSRLNANAQKREAKRKDVVHDVKFFSTSSGGGAVPRIISVVPLLPSISPKRFLRNLVDTLGLPQQELEELLPTLQDRGTYVIRAPRFKTNVQINLLPPLTVFSTLDAALVSDYVVLLLSSVDEVQLEGEAVLRCLQAQAGGVEIVSCVQVRNDSDDPADKQAPEDRPIVPSTKQLIHKSLLSFTTYFFPSVAKIHSSDTPAEAALLARALCEAAPGGTRHNEDVRAYMVAEGSGGVKWTANADNEDSGRLEIVATVRGGRLSADRLVHIPGRGDFQVESILAAPPSSLSIAAKPHHAMSVDAPMEPLSVPTDKADDLTAENTPDPLANEQTWPTEEEMGGSINGASGPSREGVRTKRVPKGTSAYQAAWIFDDEDGEDDDDDDDDEDDDDEMDDDEAPQLEERFSGDEETEEIELDSRRSELHRDLDPEQEEEEYRAYMKERERAQRDNEMYPDEIDTPKHISARTRFQRYRGLKSFRTSPWDPYENLPEDYAKIFQFENFNATSKRIEREGRAEGVSPGSRVVVILKDVPRSVAEERDQSLPFIVHGLLQHEHKTSVLHFLVQRNTEFTEPVKAKEPLVLCVGPRRYLINPIFSQHVRGGGRGVNNVHKSEKFLRAGGAMVVTTFGPVCFGKSPCILLRDEGEGEVPSLVAMGSSLPPDPTRIIAKRIILTGHPLKIHKKTATIRYMFFERDDVEYFKSVELHTKYGKVGHISEALGTHGYFKAHFDAPIGQMDTICMNLYKRQFPKWAKPYTPTEVPTLVEMDEDME